MQSNPTKMIEKVFVLAALLIVASISIPSFLIVHKATVQVESTIDKRADAPTSTMTGWSPSNAPAAAQQTAVQAVEIERALFKWTQSTGATDGTEVTFSQIAPFLAGNSHVRALNGLDGCGGKWGPFHVGEHVYPCESTKAHFAKEVKPQFWEDMEGQLRL